MSNPDLLWWRSVTVKELRSSQALVERLFVVDLTGDAQTIESLARAAAICHLVISDRTLPDLFSDAGNITVSTATNGMTDQEVDAWLDKCVMLEQVFKRALEMVGVGKDGNLLAFFEVFAMAVALKRGIHTSLAFSQGTTRPIQTSLRARLRRGAI